MPAARAASAREPPSSTRASASMRRAAFASRHRPASRRSSPAPSSFRATATVMAPSVDRLHRRSTPAGRAWRHGPNGQKPRPLGSPGALAPVRGGGGPPAVPAREPALDPRGARAPEPPTVPPVLGRAVVQRRRTGGGAPPGPPPGPLAATGGRAAPVLPAPSPIVGEPAR